MILDNNGKYYFDKNQKIELSFELISQIKKEFFNEPLEIITKEICGKIFNFQIIEKNVCKIYVDKKKEVEISIFPSEITFINENVQETRRIFSLLQYEKTLEYFKIKFPWSNELPLSKQNLNKFIFFNFSKMKITIINIDIFSMKLSEENSSIDKFIDMSKFISFYLKSEFNLNDFEEKKFLDEKLYIVGHDDKFDIYDIEMKFSLWSLLNQNIENGIKEYFFTGPYSIGKTISLLIYARKAKGTNFRRAYFNFEILNNKSNYFEILAYESRVFFDNNKDWEKAFEDIKEKEPKDFFDILLLLVDNISKKKDNNNNKYILIFDQIKFENFENKEFTTINNIRDKIKKMDNIFIIGCCSINYKGIKELLLKNLYSASEPDIIKMDYLPSLQSEEEMDHNNKLLKILGYLPRYRHLKNKLNWKIVNILCKKIKKKILSFYEKNNININKIEELVDSVEKKFEKKIFYIISRNYSF